MYTLSVNASANTYPIVIGQDDAVFANIGTYISGKQILIVSNTTVAPLYLDHLIACINNPAYHIASHVLPDGEAYKTIESLQSIWDKLMQLRFSRNCTIIALGGGVVGDMAGFAAASYQRGVNFIQVPSTLLSQVDSSVGGKTGINHPLGKNMIGAFKQPSCVLINTHMLQTLPSSELSAGLAEIIKYALIADADFLLWLETHMQSLLNQDGKVLGEAILRSCQHKADIVAADEFETNGKRALLNFGHTFGHAIETYMGYGQLLHGEAVAIGMCMASHLSFLQGDINASQLARITTIIQRANLPTQAPHTMSADDFLTGMAHDKKNVSGQIRLILLRDIGEAYLSDTYNREFLDSTLSLHQT